MSKVIYPFHRSAVLSWYAPTKAVRCTPLATQWSYCLTAKTDEKFTTFLNISPPDGGPGPHYHEREDEWFYIVEGRVSFLINGTWTELSTGDCVYSPRSSVHAFKNITDQPIRVFISITPAGFERFFAEAADWWANPERDMSHLAVIEQKYRIFSVSNET